MATTDFDAGTFLVRVLDARGESMVEARFSNLRDALKYFDCENDYDGATITLGWRPIGWHRFETISRRQVP